MAGPLEYNATLESREDCSDVLSTFRVVPDEPIAPDDARGRRRVQEYFLQIQAVRVDEFGEAHQRPGRVGVVALRRVGAPRPPRSSGWRPRMLRDVRPRRSRKW